VSHGAPHLYFEFSAGARIAVMQSEGSNGQDNCLIEAFGLNLDAMAQPAIYI
jgi:hypothetical protein